MIRVVVTPTQDELGKFNAIVRAFPKMWTGSLLDVGCRSQRLREVLWGRIDRYVGLDIASPANVLANLEKPLPFKDTAFDIVAALDVLEHVENLHLAFGEICRVASRHVVICLPNVYHFKSRIAYLLGRRISGKYGFPLEVPVDRHRWLFSLLEARDSVRALSQRNGMHVVDDVTISGPRQAKMLGVGLTGRFPGIFGVFYAALLSR